MRWPWQPKRRDRLDSLEDAIERALEERDGAMGDHRQALDELLSALETERGATE